MNNPIIAALRAQLDRPGNTSIHLPVEFNFGFDVIDYAAEHGNGTAVVEVPRDRSSVIEHRFSDIRDRSNRAANALRDLGLERADRAIVILPRVPDWYDAVLACIKLGVIAMPGTNLLTARDIEHRIQASGARAVIVSPEHVEKIESIRANCPSLEHLMVAGGERVGWTCLGVAMQEAEPALDRASLGVCASDDVMMAYFTSGTTSAPKLVPRSHGYALAHLVTGAYWLDLGPDDVHWTLTDTGWAKAAWGMLFGPWLMGAAIVLHDAEGFDAAAHLELIGRLGVTTFCAPPTIFRLFAQMELGSFDLASIRHTAGAGEPLNPEVIRVWQTATGTIIHDGYGQTETVNIVANVPGRAVRPGSMGVATPGFNVQLVDEEGVIVADDTIGNVALRLTDPPPIGLFDGYWLSPTKRDRRAFRHGLYYTGDTATRDVDGYLWFVGRADDVISSAGYRISPFEVESTLLEHPAVAESAVVGKPDAVRGHIVKAFVVLAEGYDASEVMTLDIQDFVKRTTAPYKYPREIEYRESLPKTISGKIRRVELRSEA